jgi:predicted flap endonuclease-1-like 5' DNA nuclease
MIKVEEIEGIGKKYAKQLEKAGIKTVEDLLEKGATKKGRNELAKRTGLSEKLILTWVNHADLFRVKGIGKQYAELLEAAGVDTVVELSKRNPENLLDSMIKTNEKKHLVRALPYLKQVKKWVEQAKKLPRKISY